MVLLRDEHVQLMHCVALSGRGREMDVDCYRVCKFYANYMFRPKCTHTHTLTGAMAFTVYNICAFSVTVLAPYGVALPKRCLS